MLNLLLGVIKKGYFIFGFILLGLEHIFKPIIVIPKPLPFYITLLQGYEENTSHARVFVFFLKYFPMGDPVLIEFDDYWLK